jgi:hypothetical protein
MERRGCIGEEETELRWPARCWAAAIEEGGFERNRGRAKGVR